MSIIEWQNKGSKLGMPARITGMKQPMSGDTNTKNHMTRDC
jgi:hypothetical protein